MYHDYDLYFCFGESRKNFMTNSCDYNQFKYLFYRINGFVLRFKSTNGKLQMFLFLCDKEHENN